jgi:hypothetical protein
MKIHHSIKKAFGWSIVLIGWSMIALIGPKVTTSDSGKIAATVLGLIPLPFALYLYVYDLIIPATNKSKKDDKKVHPIAFIFQYFNVIWGWTMVNMVIWIWEPSAYSHVNTITNPYKALAFIFTGSMFTSCATAPYIAIPERELSVILSTVQFYIGWITLGIILVFMFRTYLSESKKHKGEIQITSTETFSEGKITGASVNGAPPLKFRQ